MLKKLIVPSIIVILFAFCYLVIIPYVQRRNAKENVFKEFENTLTRLNVAYTKTEISAKEFGAWKAYQYIVGDKYTRIYVFNLDSKKYEEGIKNGYITTNKKDDEILYATFYNHCAFQIENEFPNETEILHELVKISAKYNNS